jgi:glycosyltransferase involved in cell wall biosynthesis
MIRHKTRRPILIFYNHEPYFLLILMIGHILGWRCILDLEDGIRRDEVGLRASLNRCLIRVYNCLCSGGAMLAASALRDQISIHPQYVCHGIAPSVEGEKNWSSMQLQVLFSGSLLHETGAGIFLETISLLLREFPEIFNHLKFVVTGYGAMSGQIERMSQKEMKGYLTFHGKLGYAEYKNIISQSHVGLCLRLPDSSIAETTFPSKVVEMAAYGLLVVSTPVSDVPQVFGNDSAVLLEETSPYALAQALRQIVANPAEFRVRALRGQLRVRSMYSSEKVGTELLTFWVGEGSVEGSTP